MHRYFPAVMVGVLLLLAPVALAQRIPHGQDRPTGPPLSPEEAIGKMTVPEGFSVELVASEPEIVNPVAMTFDERGRIWITESLEYPRKSPGPGRDRIKVLEDTDGDGRADKFTIFAEGLNIPSGIAVGYGGVWVANSPDLLFLQDTDGDGKADRSEVVVTGFGRTDTHELPNSLTWGPDGWLYGLNGVFNQSQVNHQGKEHRFTCAMFRIHPRTRAFELFAEGTSNPWGIAWDGEGSAFVSACVIDHLWHVTESGYYHRQAGEYPPHTWKIESIVDHRHQKAAYCGLTFFDSDAYPPQYRGRLYMGNIHGACINVDVLRRDGSTYAAEGEADFLRANDAWFMPVVQKTGPDGSLYVLDWYDRYHCYQDARRDPEGIDRLKGRLYRIRYKDTPRVWGYDLARETDDQLIGRLGSPNVYFRENAQRLLTERAGTTTRRKLQRLVLDASALRKARMHALWTLIGAGELARDFHLRLLAHGDASLRAWAVRAAGNAGRVGPSVRAAIVALAEDASPDVLLQVAIAARKIERIDTMETLLAVLAHSGDDKLVPHVVWQNLHPLLEDEPKRFVDLVARKGLVRSPQVALLMPRVVQRVIARGDDNPMPIFELVHLLADSRAGDPELAGYALTSIAQRVQTKEIADQRLARLRAALEPMLDQVLVGSSEGSLYLDAALLRVSWGDRSGLTAVRRALRFSRASETRRIEALGALIAAGDTELVDTIEALLGDPLNQPVAFRRQLLATLGRLNDARVAEVVLNAYPSMEPNLRPQAIDLLTQRVSWSKRLLRAVGEEVVAASALNLNQARRLLASGDPELADAVRSHWGTIRDRRNPQRESVIAEMRSFIRESSGDPTKGVLVYERVCGQCHRIYGKGATVGPDITLNGRSSFDQLLSNVFDPSLVIGAAYRSHTVVTDDGRVLNGLLVEQSDERIVLKLQGDKIETIARNQIDEMFASEVSMMPEDLERQLSEEELADLFAFITLDRPPDDPHARHLPGSKSIEPRQTSEPAEFEAILAEVAPGFTTKAAGEGGVALLKEHRGRSVVVRTHPVNRREPCVLRGDLSLPAGRKAVLVVAVSHHEKGDWKLLARVNGETVLDKIVGDTTTSEGWAEYRIDLSSYAGQTVEIKLHNHPNDWAWEFAYWGSVRVLIE